jgi:6,7-dimethyl-8-ribityllumazine synthase
MEVSLKYHKPAIFGILTTNTWNEAAHRSGLQPLQALPDKDQMKTPSHNKGKEFANAAIEMYHTIKEIEKEPIENEQSKNPSS